MNLFLNRDQIAEALKTTSGVAAAMLAEKGVSPVDWGRGRGRGLRWYAPAVERAAREMHEDAQSKNTPPSTQRKAPTTKTGLILGRSAKELFEELTGGTALQ